EAQNAYENLKGKLLSYPILSHPVFEEKFQICTDASAYGVGAILKQIINEEEHIIDIREQQQKDEFAGKLLRFMENGEGEDRKMKQASRAFEVVNGILSRRRKTPNGFKRTL
ncbi:Retrovirus-related Pol polyprotein from transposon 17.6-like protein, partial [Dinothrombium tinctorium]